MSDKLVRAKVIAVPYVDRVTEEVRKKVDDGTLSFLEKVGEPLCIDFLSTTIKTRNNTSAIPVLFNAVFYNDPVEATCKQVYIYEDEDLEDDVVFREKRRVCLVGKEVVRSSKAIEAAEECLEERVKEDIEDNPDWSIESQAKKIISDGHMSFVYDVYIFKRKAALLKIQRPNVAPAEAIPLPEPTVYGLPKPEEIISAVEDYFGLVAGRLVSGARTRKCVKARQIVAYILRAKNGETLAEIGRMLGNRDYTTIRYALRDFPYNTEIMGETNDVHELIKRAEFLCIAKKTSAQQTGSIIRLPTATA